MTTLPEIKAAADALSMQQKQELFLAARLRADASQLPAPRELSREQSHAWITEDESGMQPILVGEQRRNSHNTDL